MTPPHLSVYSYQSSCHVFIWLWLCLWETLVCQPPVRLPLAWHYSLTIYRIFIFFFYLFFPLKKKCHGNLIQSVKLNTCAYWLILSDKISSLSISLYFDIKFRKFIKPIKNLKIHWTWLFKKMLTGKILNFCDM